MSKEEGFFSKNRVLLYFILAFFIVIIAILVSFLAYLKYKKSEIGQVRLAEEVSALREQLNIQSKNGYGLDFEGNPNLGIQPTDNPSQIQTPRNALPIDMGSSQAASSQPMVGSSQQPDSGSAVESGGGNGQGAMASSNQEEQKKIGETEALDKDKWKTYTNSKYKYSFKYPQEFNVGECSADPGPCKLGKIIETDGGNTVELTSSFDGQTWPRISFAHLESAEYQLPEDRKLMDWVKEKFPSVASELPKNYNINIRAKSGNPEKGVKVKISDGGAENYHYEIYVEKDGKIYKISLQGINGQEAKDFYDDWLDTLKL